MADSKNTNAMGKKELVSVIIPTYKRSDRLTIAIDSLFQQTHPEVEIIVVDDNGNDDFTQKNEHNLRSLIGKKKIKYIKHTHNQGACAARNTGAQYALGTFLSFLDDDDFYEATKIEEQLSIFQKDPSVDACLCGMYRITEDGASIISEANYPKGENLKGAILEGNFFTSMIMIKAIVFKELKGFSNIPRFQDKFFMLKFFENNFKVHLMRNQLLTLVEHNSDRISLSNPEKVLSALNKIHHFELKHKALFIPKEWRKIKHRYLYMTAYNLLHNKTMNNRLKAFRNLALILPDYYKRTGFFKTCFKVFIP